MRIQKNMVTIDMTMDEFYEMLVQDNLDNVLDLMDSLQDVVDESEHHHYRDDPFNEQFEYIQLEVPTEQMDDLMAILQENGILDDQDLQTGVYYIDEEGQLIELDEDSDLRQAMDQAIGSLARQDDAIGKALDKLRSFKEQPSEEDERVERILNRFKNVV